MGTWQYDQRYQKRASLPVPGAYSRPPIRPMDASCLPQGATWLRFFHRNGRSPLLRNPGAPIPTSLVPRAHKLLMNGCRRREASSWGHSRTKTSWTRKSGFYRGSFNTYYWKHVFEIYYPLVLQDVNLQVPPKVSTFLKSKRVPCAPEHTKGRVGIYTGIYGLDSIGLDRADWLQLDWTR